MCVCVCSSLRACVRADECVFCVHEPTFISRESESKSGHLLVHDQWEERLFTKSRLAFEFDHRSERHLYRERKINPRSIYIATLGKTKIVRKECANSLCIPKHRFKVIFLWVFLSRTGTDFGKVRKDTRAVHGWYLESFSGDLEGDRERSK